MPGSLVLLSIAIRMVLLFSHSLIEGKSIHYLTSKYRSSKIGMKENLFGVYVLHKRDGKVEEGKSDNQSILD